MIETDKTIESGGCDGRERDVGNRFEGEGIHQGLKCSASVIDALSDKVRALCDAAVKSAQADKRKTVQDKDVQ